MKKTPCAHTMEYHPRESELSPRAATCMDLEGSMLSETRERQAPYDFTYVWNLKTNNRSKRNKNRLIETELRAVVARGDGVGAG